MWFEIIVFQNGVELFRTAPNSVKTRKAADEITEQFRSVFSAETDHRIIIETWSNTDTEII